MRKKDPVVRALSFGSGAVSFLATMLAIVLILYSGYVLYDNMAVELSAFSAHSELLKYKPIAMVESAVMGPSLAEVNQDYRAWITVDGQPASPIDYPIVQGKDDLYYASHDAYGKMSLTGAIYLAAGNKADLSDSYNLLYGHHMDNGAMFGSLDKFRDKTYFDSHSTAVVTAKDGSIYDVSFFAVVSTDAYEDNIYTVGNRAVDVVKFLKANLNNGADARTQVLIFKPAVASGAEKIIALSTCASADTNGRLVLIGKMAKRGKKTSDSSTDNKQSSKPSSDNNQESEPEEEEKPPVKLTVKYYDDKEKVYPDVNITYSPGSGYYVVSPQRPGYDVDIQIVRGTIEEDMTVIVRYIPKAWQMKIQYIYADGKMAANSYSTMIRTGEKYNVASPEVEGYKPMLLRIAGVNPGANEQYTVVYVPEGQELGNLPTPLGFERTFMQVGICFE